MNTLAIGRQAGWIAVLAILWALIPTAKAADEARPGIALAIVYDTSGSMQQSVRDADGRQTAKNVIAGRALGAVLARLQTVVAAPGASPATVEVGLVSFSGDQAHLVIPCRPFKPGPFRDWLRDHNKPQRGTPLGDAVRIGGEMVLKSTQPRKHVLVITDGVNTKGPDPTVTIPEVLRQGEKGAGAVSFHFVAFDVNDRVFSGVKRLGATVVGAADEKQLSSQLEFILEKKILLEDEEPPSAKPKTN